MSGASVGPPSRVVLLDVYVGGERFIGDEDVPGLQAPLAARGHHVRHLRVGPAASDRDGATWLERLTALVAAEPTDVLVMARAWDQRLIDAVRLAVGPGARLVRLSRGAPAALDDRFDAVVDHGGLLSLLDGADAVPPVRPGRTREQLKQLLPLEKSYLPPTPRALEVTERGSSMECGAGLTRPTISGPARGCPYLRDARQAPPFSALDLDPDRVQTRGCSFCLDNVGAYAAFPEAQIVDTWLEQLRAVRGARPDAREILLTDERPHPYLPAFFRALLEEPALAPVELLIKTRVDWLLEFADTALAEALALAERSGSVLHIYLIGFESFDQGHLDLFNKGVTVADNLRAIDAIRGLGRRFPRSLEYRRHRAHGFLLFTPWTTPESLLENARVMREVDFGEFRSQALSTRLRVYPHVPLHALAIRDGLLVEAFDGGRPDRATEQGYDASVPWRFADPRTEVIFRACRALAELAPEMSEADVLETVTRFVLRRPELADAPDSAVVPLAYAILSWGHSLSEVLAVAGPAIAGHDREIEAVAAGDKAACLKEGVAAGHVDALVQAYQARGLVAAVASRHTVRPGTWRHAEGEDCCIVAVARDQATLTAVLAAQRAVEQEHSEAAIREMGRFMGFPTCCTERFVEARDRGANVELERAPFRAEPGAPLDPRNNRLGRLNLQSHHLCSPACAPSAAKAERTLARVAALDAEGASRMRRELELPVLFFDYSRRAAVHGSWQGDRFLVARLSAIGDSGLGIDLAAGDELELSADGATAFRGHTPKTLRTANPLLVVPGAPLAPAARRAVVGASRLPADADAPRASASAPEAPGGLPPLPPGIEVGARFGDFRVKSVGGDDTVHEVVIASGALHVRLALRRWDRERPATYRRGPWGVDVVDGGPLTGAARAAVGVLTRSLHD